MKTFTSKYKLSYTNGSGRDYYTDQTNGDVFADVDGQLNALTEEGEPLCSIGVATPEPEADINHTGSKNSLSDELDALALASIRPPQPPGPQFPFWLGIGCLALALVVVYLTLIF